MDPQDLVRCEQCRTPTPPYEIVHYGSIDSGYKQLCLQCLNSDMAHRAGLEHFENVRFDQIVMNDCGGQAHEFHFRTRLLGDRLSLEAFELKDGTPGGYRFQLLADAQTEPLSLLGRLVERIRRALSVKDIEQGECGTRIAKQSVRARIDWDETEDGRVPLLIIDGQPVSWEEFGRMLMTFEGWQLRVEIKDPSDEL